MSYGQGGSNWVPGGSNTPDWDALAADADRRRRRKRTTTIIASAAAAAVIGTVVAFAVVSQSDDGGSASDEASATLPEPTDVPSGSAGSEPSWDEVSLPPLPQPREFISDAEKDTAPFDVEGFWAGDTMEIDGRSYTKAATGSAADCTEAASAELGTILTDHGCTALLRATYTGGGVAVTVGVAQFGSEADAQAARQAQEGADGASLQALTGDGAPEFCQQGGCRTTANQVGRYAYYTIAGNSDGSPDSGDGTPAQQGARDGNDHAFNRIIQRGEAQASASASALVEERQGGG
ncbi:hypothetical protein [Streptomyces sp. MP131-18]|uniref:hypothetical protein n=1 Tax=Streptomyces sp. MP131-18 TaxID=1857892 RepID=UPI00097C5BA3|nr:hypothetical protein [Streptomyces sp. MP131-18]ONK12032.1 hypothetical protein STBA_27680 [Streptomyces sp. MP131-18]